MGTAEVLTQIANLEDSLKNGDDSQATKHMQIAQFYLRINRTTEAAQWYLKAARHAAWSENLIAIFFAKKATEIAPENAEARTTYADLRARFEPDRGKPFTLPPQFRPRKK